VFEHQGDPYAEGFDAAQMGALRISNPYTPGTELYTLWKKGWTYAHEED